MGGNRNGRSNMRNFTVETRYDGQRDFYQHDDRNYSGGGNRNQRGRYKNPGKSGQQYDRDSGGYVPNRRGNWNSRGGGSRKYNQDGDTTMRDDRSNRHQQMYDQMRGRSRNNNNRNKNRGGFVYQKNFSGWNKIVLKQAASYPTAEVMGAIKELIEDDFDPVLIEQQGQNLTFFLERSPEITKALVNLSGRLTLGNNHKIYISIFDTFPPVRKLTPPQKEKIQVVLSTRYGIELKRLDLSNFHNDKVLIREQIFCPLYRHIILGSVMEILLNNCPLVEEIDLGNNQIIAINDTSLLQKFAHLKSLSLKKNKIKYLDALSTLKGLPITELTLEGNPVCDKFKEPDAYISAVREIFPKVQRLDSMDLPKPIGFEVEEDLKLPPTQPSFFFSEEAKNVVVKFIEQYYQVFESEDRRPLEAAYTEDAHFSLSCNFPESGVNAKFTTWMERENRNLIRITNPDKRHNLLQKGRAAVGDLLRRLPKMSHDPNSFVIDIPLATECLMHVVLRGVFKQVTDKSSPYRNFTKSMIIVPVGSGFCISNEELYINTATVEQVRNAFKPAPQPAPVVSSPVAAASVVASPTLDASVPPALAGLDAVKIELIKQFAINSKMLPEYCKMCLERNEWDFAKAGEMFLTLQKENKIPPEYYAHPT